MRGKISFDLYPFQIDTLCQFQVHRFNIILKSRQMGISTLCAMFALHQMLFRENFKVLVIATKTDVARNLIKKVQVMYDNLPSWLKNLANIANNNKLQLQFTNGSEIKAVSSKPDSARSEAISLLILDEAAHLPDATEIWTSAQSTLSTGGNAIILSSPNGVGNLFHQLWQKAEEGSTNDGLGRINPIRLKWDLHPDRDQTWRDAQEQLLGKLAAAQECDTDFTTSGHTVIEAEDLEYYRNRTEEPIEKRGIGGDLWIWKYVDYSRTYVTTADVSRGDGEDYSAFSIRDAETMEQVVEYRGLIDTTAYANLLISISTEYNNSLLVVDNKNVGWSTVEIIANSGYKNMYYSYKNDPYLDQTIHLMKQYDLTNKEDCVPGFTTTHILRPVLINKLYNYMKERTCSIKSTRLLNELEVFVWLNGKAQAQRGYNDDLVMEFCIFLFVRDHALRLKQMGIDLDKKALGSITKAVYTNTEKTHPSFQYKQGNYTEDLRYLM